MFIRVSRSIVLGPGNFYVLRGAGKATAGPGTRAGTAVHDC